MIERLVRGVRSSTRIVVVAVAVVVRRVEGDDDEFAARRRGVEQAESLVVGVVIARVVARGGRRAVGRARWTRDVGDGARVASNANASERGDGLDVGSVPDVTRMWTREMLASPASLGFECTSTTRRGARKNYREETRSCCAALATCWPIWRMHASSR